VNNQRRKDIDQTIKSVETLKTRFEELLEQLSSLKDEAQEAHDEVERIRDEEQEYLDNMPESLQSSDRYYTAEAAISQLDEAMEKLNEVTGLEVELPDFDEVVTNLDEAKA
jgi:uncharacterized coiled-coil DUF342 family protein